MIIIANVKQMFNFDLAFTWTYSLCLYRAPSTCAGEDRTGELMKSKQLLRFYFSAESMNRALDNLIIKNALSSVDCGRDGKYYADKICALICAKSELSSLWSYLDGIVRTFDKSEKTILRFYGTLRGGTTKLSIQNKREIKRVAVKFARRTRFLDRYSEGVKLVGKYYCLIK